MNTPILAALMAEAQLDETFARSFRSGFLARRRKVLLEVLQRARTRGEVGASVDIDFLVEIVFGALWYASWLAMPHSTGPFRTNSQIPLWRSQRLPPLTLDPSSDNLTPSQLEEWEQQQRVTY